MSSQEKSPISTSPAFKGSCACGRITYESSEAPLSGQTMVCHCLTCRKLSGGPYQAFAHIHAKALTLFDHKEHLRYEGLPKENMGGIVFIRFSDVADRPFCASCYSPLAMRYHDQPDMVSITLGTVDEESVTDPKVREALALSVHSFIRRKAWWLDIEKDGLPKVESFTPRFDQDEEV